MILISIDENTIFPLRQNAVAEALGDVEDTRAVEPPTDDLKYEKWQVRTFAKKVSEKIKAKKT